MSCGKRILLFYLYFMQKKNCIFLMHKFNIKNVLFIICTLYNVQVIAIYYTHTDLIKLEV